MNRKDSAITTRLFRGILLGVSFPFFKRHVNLLHLIITFAKRLSLKSVEVDFPLNSFGEYRERLNRK